MATFGLNDIVLAQDGQTVFRTTRPYLQGSETLFIYVNGMLSVHGADKDYIELDEYNIEFNRPLYEGDVVVLTSSFVNPDMDITVVGSRSDSIFRKYGGDVRLKNNHRYNIDLRVKGAQIKWGFTSRYSPLHSDVRKIRSDTGGLLDNVSDDKINYIIYLNSKEAEEIMESQRDEYAFDTAEGTPKYVNYWVRYKTNLDLVYAAYLTISGQNGSSNKKIGPIAIEQTFKIPFLKDMLSRFQKLLDQYDPLLRGMPQTTFSFVKGNTTNQYPHSTRGSF